LHIIDVMRASELRIGNWVKIKDEIFEDGWETGYDIYKTNEFQITGFNDGSAMKGCKIICFYEIPGKIMGGTIHSGCRDLDIDPIPLTEEWLLKFGFVKQDYNMSGCDIYKLKNIIIMKSFVNPERKHMGITVEGISPPTWSLKDLIHVHELQNLYFALIGEELVVKE